jgi:hypothetical protein
MERDPVMENDEILTQHGIRRRDLLAAAENEIEFSQNLLRMANAGQPDSAHEEAIEQLLSAARSNR